MAEPRLALISCLKDTIEPPLQLASIATYLREYDAFEQVRILDIGLDPIIKILTQFQPDMVGLSVMTPLYNEAIRLAQTIKKYLPNTTMIIGGHHITMLPQSLHPVFDIAVIGEGEETTRQLMLALREKQKLSADTLQNIDGLAYWHDAQLKITNKRQLINPLDKIPIPDRSILNKKYILSKQPMYCLGWKRVRVANIFTARGCPYDCAFCSGGAFWDKTRLHSPQRVAQEIEVVRNVYKTDFIYIEDDLFTVNKQRVRDVIEQLRQKNLLGKIAFACQPRINLIDQEMCRLMVEMGVVLVGFGFESGNPQMLEYLKGSHVSPDMAIDAVRLCKQHGLTVQGSVILGNPGETLDQMRDTLAFLDRVFKAGIDDVWPFICSPLPGTQIWQYACENKLIDEYPNWDLWNFTKPHPQRPKLYDPNINFEKFQDLYFSVQALLEKRRPRLPLASKIKRLPRFIRKTIQTPSMAYQVAKHRLLVKTFD